MKELIYIKSRDGYHFWSFDPNTNIARNLKANYSAMWSMIGLLDAIKSDYWVKLSDAEVLELVLTS